MTDRLQLELTSAGLGELLTVAHHTHVLLLINPGHASSELLTLADHPRRLVLSFHDEILPRDGYVLPTPEDVAAILAFGAASTAAPAGGAKLLMMHCHSGVARSTAAAIMLVTQAQPDVSNRAIAPGRRPG